MAVGRKDSGSLVVALSGTATIITDIAMGVAWFNAEHMETQLRDRDASSSVGTGSALVSSHYCLNFKAKGVFTEWSWIDWLRKKLVGAQSYVYID